MFEVELLTTAACLRPSDRLPNIVGLIMLDVGPSFFRVKEKEGCKLPFRAFSNNKLPFFYLFDYEWPA